ncbi:response regulator [Sulfurimonas sp.]|uniref:response regulator transcription factor n=1 Tax=Sulfurimonas sp. TaxID=2022749 RepID=UPI002AB07F51|nr:response regulator [Sulfurimonas sp.]
MVENSIIIVEDDEITALNLNLSLQKHGYDVIAVCDNAIDAKVKIEELEPDIVIIDISLDESNDGIELGDIVRREYHIPFIYLTSYSDDNIIAQAKLTEPYGYIVKPFDPSSLHATLQMAIFKYEVENARKINTVISGIDILNVEKLLLTKQESDKPIVYFGGEYYIDIKISETFYKDKKIKLTKKENAFLRLLVAQLGSVVTFEQAMDYVWQESGATANSVRTLVWRLRNKLPKEIIKNASGIGYCIEE